MKKKTVLSFVLLLVISFLLFLPCEKDLYCTGKFSSIIQYPFVWFILSIPLSLFALTLNDQKHKFWLKFTGIFFAISMVFVFATPEYGSGIVSIDRELTNWFFAGLYSFISIIYFIIQFIKNRSKSTI